uniref:SOSEKI DIX-like domain-containing protein n=1 Tax=Oryza glumipatula TaxID=40148 RepID=A0A0D9YFR7_9ORYZ
MEKGGGSQKGGGGGGGEARRINVVYFLSRGGRTDHPHLFRVNHHRAGVRLRDVKRWLSELRGQDMADNFSWSYKRKYKAGYIWQDLMMDDDLITPISDNEYVLKGCDVRRATESPKEKSSSLAEEPKKLNGQEVKVACDQKQVEEVTTTMAPDSDERSPKKPPPADQDSPVGEGGEPASRSTAPLKKDLPRGLREERKKQQREVVKVVSKAVVVPAPAPEQKVKGAASGRISSHPPPAVGSARRMHLAQLLHNLLTCGAADADDTALRPVLRHGAAGADDDGGDWPRTPVCPGIDGCGLRVGKKVKVRRGGKDKAKPKRDGGKRDGGDSHKPASLPRCSQCGKEFKPQELHSHMQSCRVFREKMRSSTSSRVSVDRGRTSAAARTEHRRTRSKGAAAAPGDTSDRPSAVLLLRDS